MLLAQTISFDTARQTAAASGARSAGQPAQAQPQPLQVNPEELLKQLFKKR